MLTGLSFILYIYYILCVVRRAAYPQLIQFNTRNIYKIRIVQTPRVLQWSRTAILQQESPSHQGTEKQRRREWERARCASPSAPHQLLCTRLCIHRIRAHTRPHNALHSPSIVTTEASFPLPHSQHTILVQLQITLFWNLGCGPLDANCIKLTWRSNCPIVCLVVLPRQHIRMVHLSWTVV